MRRFLRFSKLNQRGFDHVLLGVAFAVIIALGGTYYLIETHANAWSGALKVNMTKTSMCMENMANSNVANTTIELNKCNSTSEAQHWSFQPQGSNFQIVAAASKACVDDYRQRITPAGQSGNSSVAAYVITWSCSSADKGQLWHWGSGANSHLLVNVGSGGCINDPKSSTTAGTRLVVFSCAASAGGTGTNAQWIEVANSNSGSTTSGTGTGSGSGTTTPPISTTSEVIASIGSNMCVTAGSAVTLQTCASTATQQWGHVSTASGSSTMQFYNASTKSYLGVSGSKIVDTSASGNALWTNISTSSSTVTLEQLTGSNGNTGVCLNVPNGSAGTQLSLYNCSASSPHQQFVL